MTNQSKLDLSKPLQTRSGESRGAADQQASSDRLACIAVPWIEGEGLEGK